MRSALARVYLLSTHLKHTADTNLIVSDNGLNQSRNQSLILFHRHLLSDLRCFLGMDLLVIRCIIDVDSNCSQAVISISRSSYHRSFLNPY